jgi:hypothetical protein
MGVIWFLALLAGADWDAAAHRLTAHGAAAADVRAPSAAIARVKAERTAREHAEKKIAAALKELHKKRDLKTAQVTAIEYGSDGSVELTLTLDLQPSPSPSPEP